MNGNTIKYAIRYTTGKRQIIKTYDTIDEARCHMAENNAKREAVKCNNTAKRIIWAKAYNDPTNTKERREWLEKHRPTFEKPPREVYINSIASEEVA